MVFFWLLDMRYLICNNVSHHYSLSLFMIDKYVRENDENWTSKQSAACVKSGTGINTFRDKFGEN